MKYPHHRYIKYLITLGLDDDEVERMLILDKLVPPTPADVARFRYDLADQPKSFRLTEIYSLLLPDALAAARDAVSFAPPRPPMTLVRATAAEIEEEAPGGVRDVA